MSFVADLRVLLEGRDFRRLFGTRLVSQSSDGIFQFAVGGYAFFNPERHTTAIEIAVGLAVLLLPYSLLGPFVGVFIDRWPRRQILVIAPLVRGILLLGTAGLVLVGAPDAFFFTAALCVLGVNRFFLAALGASLPHVVPPERLMMANAVTPTSGTVATFVGAAAGFGLRRLLGPEAAGTAQLLICSGLVFGLSALIARTLDRSLLGPAFDPTRPQARQAVRHVLTGLVDGMRHIVHRRMASGALSALSTHRLMYGISTAMVVMLYRYAFTTDTEVALGGMALVLATSGAGYFLAAIVTPWATRRVPVTWWIPGLLVACGVLEFALCAPLQQWAFPIAGFVLGVGGQSIKICTDTVVQRDVDDPYLGRVFSLYDMLFNGMTVLGAALAAVLLPPDGRSVSALGVIAGGYLLGALIYRLVIPTRGSPVPVATK